MRQNFTEFDNFLKKNTGESSNGYLFSNKYDEPTYLSVRVNFFPDNIAKENRNNLSDYSYNSSKTISYNDMPHPLFDKTSAYSTISYLRDKLGDENRANLLGAFINGIMDLNYECPYYIKSVNGLNDLMIVDPKRGSRVVKNGTITLKCIEGLDMRITSLLNMYKKIVWDDVYQRWILPDIMRFFKMNIIISEFRLFNNIIGYKDDKFIYGEESKDINLKIPTIKYECQMCEFDITDTIAHFNQLNIDNIKTPLEDIEIKIKVGNIIEHDKYDLFTNSVDINDLILCKITKSDNLNENDKNKVAFNERFNKTFSDFKYDIGAQVINNDSSNKETLTNSNSNYDKIMNIDAKVVRLVGGTVLSNKKTWTNPDKTKYDPDDYNKINTSQYLDKLLSGTFNNIVNLGTNFLDDKAKEYFYSYRFPNGLTGSDYLNLALSPNLLYIINEAKLRSKAIDKLYPEVSQATSNNLGTNLYKDVVKTIITSSATNNETVTEILSILNEQNKTIDDYNDKIINLLSKPSSSATDSNKINKQIL